VNNFFVRCSAVTNHSAQRTIPPAPDEIDGNKALARIWFQDVINHRNLDAVTHDYAVDYVHHGPEGVDMQGREAAGAFAASLLAASDDRQAVVEQQVAEGDYVVTRCTSSGHHTGVFHGIQPTGNVWTTKGICISRMKDGKIVEDWEIIHSSGLQSLSHVAHCHREHWRWG
jgi:predicted ester cyclase